MAEPEVRPVSSLEWTDLAPSLPQAPQVDPGPAGELAAADREFISDLSGRPLDKGAVEAAVTERLHRKREPC